MNWHSSLWGEWENSECDIIGLSWTRVQLCGSPHFLSQGEMKEVALGLPVAHPNAVAGIPNSSLSPFIMLPCSLLKLTHH